MLRDIVKILIETSTKNKELILAGVTTSTVIITFITSIISEATTLYNSACSR